MDKEGEGEREIEVNFEVLPSRSFFKVSSLQVWLGLAACNWVRKCKSRLWKLKTELIGRRGISEAQSFGLDMHVSIWSLWSPYCVEEAESC